MSRFSGTGSQHGAIAVVAIVALVLLATFYSVVTGVVDHAQLRRSAAAMTLDAGKTVSRSTPPRAGRETLAVAGAVD